MSGMRSNEANLLQMRGQARPSEAGNVLGRPAAVAELTFRPGQVCLKPFPDDLRGAKFMADTRIHVPEMYTEPSRFATVVALGPMRWIPGEWWKMSRMMVRADIYTGLVEVGANGTLYEWLPGFLKPFSVNVGETVVSTRYPKSAQQIIWGDEHYVLVDEDEILAKVEHGA